MDTYSLVFNDTEVGEITSTVTNEKAEEALTGFEQSGWFENRSKAILEIVAVLLYNSDERSIAQALAVLDDAKRYLLETTLANA